MSREILEMLTSVTLLMFVIPPTYAGGSLLLRGNLLFGGCLLGIAVAMVVADQYIITPDDLPVLVASKFVGIFARPPDEE